MRKCSLFLLLSMFFVYANANTTNANVANPIVGTWWSPFTIEGKMGRVSITYSADGNLNIVLTMTVENQTISETIAGTWSVTDDTLTLIDTDCGNESGYYKITSIDKRSLTLSLISDACEERGIEVADSWTRG
mgnify:CR=1 FL=1